MNKKSKIFVAGGTGLVGSAILRTLVKEGYENIIASFLSRKPDKNLSQVVKYEKINLLSQDQVNKFFLIEKPEYVFLAAAKVGGIHANNTYRADFIYDNLQIQNNIIHNCYLNNVKKMLFLGSSCIYPRNCPQPMKEEYLLTSPLEYTNEPYALAKIAGIKMCESYNLQYKTNFIPIMPTNLYGYNDNFDLANSHVLPALIRKMHLGKLFNENRFQELSRDIGENDDITIRNFLKKHGIGKEYITFWGSGTPFREFLFSDDMADACVYIMDNINFSDLTKGFDTIRNTHVNIGTGKDISIKELGFIIKEIVDYQGDILWDISKPDGTPKKLLDVSKLFAMGWKPQISLKDGIQRVYKSYLESKFF